MSPSAPVPQKIEKALHAELERTRRDYEAAREKFHTLSSGIPSGLPHPDGSHRIQQAAREYRSTLNAYAESVRRFNDYILKQVIPKDHL